MALNCLHWLHSGVYANIYYYMDMTGRDRTNNDPKAHNSLPCKVIFLSTRNLVRWCHKIQVCHFFHLKSFKNMQIFCPSPFSWNHPALPERAAQIVDAHEDTKVLVSDSLYSPSTIHFHYYETTIPFLFVQRQFSLFTSTDKSNRSVVDQLRLKPVPLKYRLRAVGDQRTNLSSNHVWSTRSEVNEI